MTASLSPRSKPVQVRSKATVEHLLDVSMALLAQHGLEAFNTNLLAERAGVGVRAIYRYFPNKRAILMVLAERARDRERAWAGDLRSLAREVGWREAVNRSIDGYYESARKEKGLTVLRSAIRAIPELRAVEDAASAEFQKDLAQTLKELGVDIERKQMKALCQVVIESCAALLDTALLSPPSHARRLVGELKRMICALLESHIDG